MIKLIQLLHYMQNRPIKFRVWSKIYNKFLDESFYIDVRNIEHNDYIFQQFTGLKDKNGKEIYEGDIINFHIAGFPHAKYPEDIYNAEVYYDNEYACFMFCESRNIENSWSMGDYGIENLEIIGNIFKNPELTK